MLIDDSNYQEGNATLFFHILTSMSPQQDGEMTYQDDPPYFVDGAYFPVHAHIFQVCKIQYPHC